MNATCAHLFFITVFIFLTLVTRVYGSQEFAENSFTFEHLTKLIEEKQIKSIDHLLPLLPDRLRTFYVLMKKSKSRHQASEETPRVIVYDYQNFSDGLFLMAFGGDPSDRNYNILEVIQFRDKTSNWEFREIIFPASPSSLATVEISGPNPSKCFSCHGSTPRPIWEPYPFWPGAVSEDDTLRPAEKAYLEDFISKGSSHPRYQSLFRKENLEENQRLNKFGNRFTLSFVGLSSTISSIQFHRVLPITVMQTPEFHRYKFALVAALLDCDGIIDFVPQSLGLGGATHWKELYSDTWGKISKMDRRHASLVAFQHRNTRIATHLRYLLEPRGINISHWQTSNQGPYLFDPVGLDLSGWGYTLKRLDPEMEKMEYDWKKKEESCLRFKESSIVALSMP